MWVYMVYLKPMRIFPLRTFNYFTLELQMALGIIIIIFLVEESSLPVTFICVVPSDRMVHSQDPCLGFSDVLEFIEHPENMAVSTSQ